ncbi:unnamed protein product [Rotaria magnacalcarata]|uniref:G-protein coupled receptors family 1 profile domain-containing protein n=1 Tax=Rotaria magnacalcarata TaxID=392030 RepID=A0A816ZTC0_9BILA|nr:unnamed protein product [Rotaria magnacalcarata]CAF2230939.1 unnamed protein product [Rotaria magnacalcarata]CAF3974121.1 unnamed protein product [Rotaria magnacalcarata]CAF4148639.1 unnamed protein product [Rotaria magnacalcarata]
MADISNRVFLQIHCISLDFLLRVFLTMDQWLNACVATERAVTVIKATYFHKEKSKRIAKIIIAGLLIFIIGTSIHDPVYRRIIDEQNDDEKRIWCIVTYPRGLTVYNSMVQTFHFLAPFMINVVSAVILIATKSRRQTAVQTRRTYRELLQAQFRQHQYLFTGPVLLVILGLPRLIMSFVLKCMKSKNDAWYFSIGYFISFLPPMLTFVIFILPSKFYKREFHESLTIYLSRMKRHLQFNT